MAEVLGKASCQQPAAPRASPHLLPPPPGDCHNPLRSGVSTRGTSTTEPSGSGARRRRRQRRRRSRGLPAAAEVPNQHDTAAPHHPDQPGGYASGRSGRVEGSDKRVELRGARETAPPLPAGGGVWWCHDAPPPPPRRARPPRRLWRCPPPSRPPQPGRAAGSAAVRRGQGRPSAPAVRVVAKEMRREGGREAGINHTNSITGIGAGREKRCRA